uniref:Uncharacterized protein n=1 Tax=Anguilla anguilla TaxID=7936 RepID=A0A0E9PN79_ANGAN
MSSVECYTETYPCIGAGFEERSYMYINGATKFQV